MSGGGNVDSGGWTNLRFPNAFAHPFEFQGRDGKVRKRMLVTIPKGVVLADGRDLGGWSLSVHASPWALAQKQAGRPVSIGLRVGRSVELFKGRGARRRVLRLDGPEDLRIALDEHRDRMTGRHTDSGKPFENDSTTRTSMASRERVRGSLDDAAPPSYVRPTGMGQACSTISRSIPVSCRAWTRSYPVSPTISLTSATMRISRCPRSVRWLPRRHVFSRRGTASTSMTTRSDARQFSRYRR